jgi:hypothetical protein
MVYLVQTRWLIGPWITVGTYLSGEAARRHAAVIRLRARRGYQVRVVQRVAQQR